MVLPLLKSDLLTIMRAVENETLADTPVEFSDGAACCVMLASGGYPGKYEKGKTIDLGNAEAMAEIFHSGTALRDMIRTEAATFSRKVNADSVHGWYWNDGVTEMRVSALCG